MSRTGIGYDSHRFAPGGPLRLGGIDIPAEQHLTGHSDADAVCHALTDAVLGAVGAGDVGTLFPDSEAVNKGRDSIEMLSIAVDRVFSGGWRVESCDVTVVCEQPKIGPHRDAMCERLAHALRVKSGHVSVKGKTNEGMGWIGRGEGLAVLAVATLVPRNS